MIEPGHLRHRGKFSELNPDTLPDDYGEPKQEWLPYMTRWVSDEPLRGRELFQAQQANSLVNHRVRMRYSDRVKPQHRVEIRGRVLNIESVINPQTKDHELHLMCTEVDGA